MLETIGVAITCRYIFPIDPIAATSITETIGVKDATIEVAANILTIVIKQKLVDYEWEKQKREKLAFFPFCTPSGARTLDPNIKSVVLYQLS